MNKLIEKLAEQAQKVVGHTDGGYTEIKVLDQEKFAELIVKECIQFRTELTQFDNTTPYGDGYENGLNDMAELIAEHFGVEE